MTFIGGLCGFGISRVKPRSGRFAMVVPGLVLIMTYYFCVLGARAYLNSEEPGTDSFKVQLGFGSVHLLFLISGLWLVSRHGRPAGSPL